LREEVAGALGINPASGDFMREAERLAAIYQASLPDNVVYYEDLLAAEAARAAEENKSEDEKPGAEKPADEQDAKTDSRENKAPSPEKPSRQTDKAPKRQPRQLRAAVVNCSGDPASGKKMEALLQNNGVTVTEVSNGHAQNQSSIISNTYDGWVLSRLAALPFRYSLKLAKNSDAAVEAVIYVGKDFT
jgi:hypothetical protein